MAPGKMSRKFALKGINQKNMSFKNYVRADNHDTNIWRYHFQSEYNKLALVWSVILMINVPVSCFWQLRLNPSLSQYLM